MDAAHDCAAPPARPAVPVRIYVHNAISTLVAGAQLSSPRMTRHDAVLLVALGDTPFTIEANGQRSTLHAAAVAPNARHAVHAEGCQLMRLAVHIIHPRFPTLRLLLKRAVTPYARELFQRFDTRLQDAYHGRLDALEAGQLMDEIVGLLLADAPPAPPIDPRIVWALKQLEADINHPFDSLAAALGVSQSRLSHLFTQHLGVSLRGCQAWGRMVMAWEMLTWKQPNLSLTAVAHALSFSDSSHLSRAFKRRYGMTPTMFRNPRIVEINQLPVPAGSRIPSVSLPSVPNGKTL